MRSTLTGSRRGEGSLGMLEEAGGVGVSLVSGTNSSDIVVYFVVDYRC